jgi:uncharacterized protein YndB with AHSA1/START domain
MWRSEFSVETAASPEAVWRILSDVAAWPSWNPGYTAASLDGPLVTGSTGSVTLANGWERQMVVYEVEPGTFFAYGGDIPGGRQRFLQRVERLGAGRTRVTLGHTIAGMTWPLFGLLFGRTIRAYLPKALSQSVAKAEALDAREASEAVGDVEPFGRGSTSQRATS